MGPTAIRTAKIKIILPKIIHFLFFLVSIFNQMDNSSIFHKALKLSIEKLLNAYTLHNIKGRNFQNILSLASRFTSKDILNFILEK